MLMPQELKKYAFNHALRGYSTAEVDEYIEFLCAKYEELYRENGDLERKLIAALRTLDEAKRRENDAAPQPAAADERRQAGRILAEAEHQKKRIVADAEEYADRIIADADAHVAEQAQVLENMKQAVLAFRDELYARYSRQIDEIEAFAALAQSAVPHVSAGTEEAVEIEEAEDAAEAEETEEVEVAGEAEAAEEVEDTDEPAEDSEPELLWELTEDPDEPLDDVDEEGIAETDEALGFFEEDDDTDGAEEAGDTVRIEEIEEIEEPEEIEEIEVIEEPEEIEEIEEVEEVGDAEEIGEPDGLEEIEDLVPEEISGEEDDSALLLSLLKSIDNEDTFAELPESVFGDDEDMTIVPEEDEAAEEPDDDALLEELRQAFRMQLEDEAEDDGKQDSQDGDEFSFLPETEEKDEEPLRFFERFSPPKKNDARKSDKKNK